MAIVKGGMGSMLSGKVEGLVYVQLNGQTITRKAPKHKKDSWTPGMLQNQQRFREVNSFCGQFKYSVIPQIWNGAALSNFSKASNFGNIYEKKMSGYAFFLKSNMPAFAPDGSLADQKLIRLSTGKLNMPQGLVAGRPEAQGNIIEVSWEKELHVGGVHLKDELMVISAADGIYSDIMATGIPREAMHGTFELPTAPEQATHLYLFFASKDRTDYSLSICCEV